ncbi:glycosyltransferase [Herbiconiux sp. L3-i23]|uniref:glycosyltransferase n=1 Tax=Herbiconiux sp. L3-i23 TaxID=2905871 RepID=UPI002046DDD9|nr:glycosyltransferase [Herbiconiux sp. L3-i23]BDI23607.1 hypothetical protein L3i23_23830 [Herbiconiux sp. L3-i23]
MGIQTSLDALLAADRIVDALRLADDLAFEASRDPGPRTIRVLSRALRGDDTVAVISAVHALAAVHDDEAGRVLTGLLSDARPFVREHAAWALGSSLPRLEAVGRLIALVADGGFTGMLAQRTLELWSSAASDSLAVALESALVGVSAAGPRARLVETLGLVRSRIVLRTLIAVACDVDEHERVRVAATAALGQRPGEAAVESALLELSMGGDYLADVARLSLGDLHGGLPLPDLDDRDDAAGLTVAQLFLHADIDAGLTAVGAGDNGGIATLLVRLGDALIADPSTPVDRVLTLSRGSIVHAADDLTRLRSGADGHVFGRVPLLSKPVPSPKAWGLRVAARRGIRRILKAAGRVDLIHLRMADVGSLAAADVARELDIPVIFTVAPDPHAVIQSLDLSGRLTREGFGETDLVEHFWFRCGLVGQLAANASHTVLFPRPRLEEDMRSLVGIDITRHAERHSVIPEGVDLDVLDAAVAAGVQLRDGAAASPAQAEFIRLLETLPPERRELPVIVSVGRLHRVKGMATLVSAWARSDLRERANLLIVGGDVETPSADEREQLDAIREVIPPVAWRRSGLLLPGHRPNDVAAQWLALVREGVPGVNAAGGLYVCASLKEEFGIALLEAMGAGLFVVAPDGAGPATYVRDGETGLLTATWDEDRLADGVARALTISTGETDGSRAAVSRATVADRFTIEAMGRALGGVYSSVTGTERALRAEGALLP